VAVGAGVAATGALAVRAGAGPLAGKGRRIGGGVGPSSSALLLFHQSVILSDTPHPDNETAMAIHRQSINIAASVRAKEEKGREKTGDDLCMNRNRLWWRQWGIPSKA
jgi:hypothetical protein